MRKQKQLYVAYGSDLDRAIMAHRCPTAKPIAKGWLHDYRLVFQGNPFGARANVIPEDGQEVPVVIWELTPKDEASLDRYLGLDSSKEFIEIEVAGEMKEALIYFASSESFGVPTDAHLDAVAQGYDDFNFPVSYLNDALLYSLERRPNWWDAGRALNDIVLDEQTNEILDDSFDEWLKRHAEPEGAE